MLSIKKALENIPELSLENQKNKLVEHLKKIAEEFQKICGPAASYKEDEKILCAPLIKKLNDFFSKYQDRVGELIIPFSEHFARELEALTSNLPRKNAYSSAYKKIEPFINEFLNTLKQIISKPLFEVTDEMLATEEKRVAEQKKLDSNVNFKSTLQKISNTAADDDLNKPKIFISYAWPVADQHREEWTKDFILKLQQHLKAAGLIVLLDQDQSGFGTDMFKFMSENIQRADHVLIICDRTMQYKFEEDGLTGVCFEYLQVVRRWREHRKQNFAIPICLNKESFIPGLVGKAAEISIYKEGYLASLKEIIRRSYGYRRDEFEQLWPEELREKSYATLMSTMGLLPAPAVSSSSSSMSSTSSVAPEVATATSSSTSTFSNVISSTSSATSTSSSATAGNFLQPH